MRWNRNISQDMEQQVPTTTKPENKIPGSASGVVRREESPASTAANAIEASRLP